MIRRRSAEHGDGSVGSSCWCDVGHSIGQNADEVNLRTTVCGSAHDLHIQILWVTFAAVICA